MDVNVRAFRTVQAAISGQKPDARKEAARKGGLIGGRVRASNMTAQQRREIAVKASKARWAKTDSGKH
jgi:hypothetical protein